MSQTKTFSIIRHETFTDKKLKLQHHVILSNAVGFAQKGLQLYKSLSTLADESNCDPKTIKRAMTYLIAEGYIVVVKERAGLTTIYDLADKLKKELKIGKYATPTLDKTPNERISKRSKTITTTVRKKVKNSIISLKELFKQRKAPEEVQQIVEAENTQPHRENAPLDFRLVWAKFLAHHKDRTPNMTPLHMLRLFRGWCEREQHRYKSPKKPRYASKTRRPRQSQQQVWENKANAYMQQHHGETLVLGGPFG